ncbi:hypothetical protein [Microtetraspora malaysiensis]|uniref:4Fe-4S ferredoxin-type domain-containing protein n=1 Tax=Microtetraspora malaysiensis TaxID=161358 RepID=A0ABW6SKF8_9ACTN
MPIYLPAPAHDSRGPDGDGWNRLSLNAGPVYPGQCALAPTSYATLWESQDTRRARWGGFGPCVRCGDCTSCPAMSALRRGRAVVCGTSCSANAATGCATTPVGAPPIRRRAQR